MRRLRSGCAGVPPALAAHAVLAGIMLLLAVLAGAALLSYPVGAFPDELAHLGYAADVARLGYPDYRTGLLYDADKLNYLPHPALYYLVAGAVARLLPAINEHGARLIRLINLPVALCTVWLVYRAMARLALRPAAIGFGLLTLLAIPMFVLLSAAVSNDPLAILGCALATLALVRNEGDKNPGPALLLLLAAVLVTALTKATGLLTVLCLAGATVLVNYPAARRWHARLARRHWLAMVLAGAVTAGYFLVVFVHWQHFFPAPQGDPSLWFKTETPDAPRWTALQHLAPFYASNRDTLSLPYGHIRFADLTWRPALLQPLLALYPLFALAALRGEARRSGGYARLVGALLLAQLVYVALYFAAVHLLHVATGYPGAMQARYAFGFLPGIALIYAVGFSHLWAGLRWAVTALALSAVAALSYTCVDNPLATVARYQLDAAVHYGELTAGRRFAQSFSAPASVDGVDLMLATFTRSNRCRLVLRLLDERGQMVAEADTGAEHVVDNGWTRFALRGPRLRAGHMYTLELSSPDGRAGRAITWWAAPTRAPPSPFGGSRLGGPQRRDGTGGGSATVDGRQQPARFAFRLFL